MELHLPFISAMCAKEGKKQQRSFSLSEKRQGKIISDALVAPNTRTYSEDYLRGQYGAGKTVLTNCFEQVKTPSRTHSALSNQENALSSVCETAESPEVETLKFFPEPIVRQSAPSFHEKSEAEKRDAMAIWSGFFKKTLRERQDQVRLVYPHLDISVLHNGGLSGSVADVMVENCIGISSLPIGVAPNFIINNKLYVVPMAIEEPSVIAAASGIAKLVSSCGGFIASSTPNIMTAQVQLCDWGSKQLMLDAVKLIELEADRLIDLANLACESMKKRGGGVISVYARIVEPRRERKLQSLGYVVVHFDVNVCEAMGANVVNSIAEAMAPTLESLTKSRAGLKILTNLCTKRVTKCSFKIPCDQLGWKGVPGRIVAERIVEAYHFADDDEHRAATHNKGVFNGIDAVAIALGQDWRAIEAAAHSYSISKLGYYGPVTKYYIEDTIENDVIVGSSLVGEIEIPIAVGTKGGALQTHPTYKFTHALLGNPDAQTVGQIICSVGLAQNMAALRALAIEGIQRGHMSLHARNIAVASGVPTALVPEVASYMVSRNRINTETAKEYLVAHSLFQVVNPDSPRIPHPLVPSTFSVELSALVNINIAFPTLGPAPLHLVIAKDHVSTSLQIQNQLLGNNKGFTWLRHVYDQLDRIKLHNVRSQGSLRSISQHQDKLKLISILLNLISYNLLKTYPVQTSKFLQDAINLHDNTIDLTNTVPTNDPLLAAGFPLLLSLWRVFFFLVDDLVGKVNETLAQALVAQQCFIINCMIVSPSVCAHLLKDDSLTTVKAVSKFMQVHGSRFQVTMFLLCDCISLSLTTLSPARMEFIHQLGEFFEWEGTISHDIQKTRKTGFMNGNSSDIINSNVYELWLTLENRNHSIESEADFLEVIDKESRERERIILLSREDSEFFDADNFVHCSRLLRDEYEIPHFSP